MSQSFDIPLQVSELGLCLGLLYATTRRRRRGGGSGDGTNATTTRISLPEQFVELLNSEGMTYASTPRAVHLSSLPSHKRRRAVLVASFATDWQLEAV